MELKKIHFFGIIAGVIVIGLSFAFLKTQFFFFIIWLGILTGVFPFVLTTIQKNRISQEKEIMFLEFTRNLVESVETGTSISKSLVNLKKKSFGSLSKHVEKLANQISMGIPLKTALEIFAKDVDNKTVSRTITLIGQAERAGGNIGQILESVAKAVSTTDKLKKERESTISNLVVQGYIIFLVFIVIILVMQFYIIPMISGIANVGSLGATGVGATAGGGVSATDVSQAFLYLLLIQGVFSGLVIGKLSAGDMKKGIKHSFTLVVLAFLISTVANILFGK
ncbi:Type II secretion system (T2SS), protein F [uncultured archaeon]|nr:Type II secretion system (T2SS), protein F [uncultured archaeon]